MRSWGVNTLDITPENAKCVNAALRNGNKTLSLDLIFFLFFEIGSHCGALAGLKLTI